MNECSNLVLASVYGLYLLVATNSGSECWNVAVATSVPMKNDLRSPNKYSGKILQNMPMCDRDIYEP